MWHIFYKNGHRVRPCNLHLRVIRFFTSDFRFIINIINTPSVAQNRNETAGSLWNHWWVLSLLSRIIMNCKWKCHDFQLTTHAWQLLYLLSYIRALHVFGICETLQWEKWHLSDNYASHRYLQKVLLLCKFIPLDACASVLRLHYRLGQFTRRIIWWFSVFLDDGPIIKTNDTKCVNTSLKSIVYLYT